LVVQIQAIMERDEACFDHSGAVRRLLMRALTVMDPGRPARHRFRATLHMKLAEELSNVEVSQSLHHHVSETPPCTPLVATFNIKDAQ
jgi:hypothetical protein